MGGRRARRPPYAGLELVSTAFLPYYPSIPTGTEASGANCYFTCLFTSLVISNMLTLDLPLKTGFSFASALIIRRFFLS